MIELGIARAPVERRNYTQFRVDAAVAEATGAAVRGAAFGAVEIAAGMFARAFAACEVEPAGARTAALTPAVLSSLARSLLTRGEWLAAIEVDAGQVALYEAADWDVLGAGRTGWRYRVNTAVPSGTLVETLPAAGVVHVRYATRPGEPWRGRPPLWFAEDSRALAAALERRLGQELAGPVGHLIAMPADAGGEGGDEDPHAALKGEIAGLAGRVALVETTAAGFGEGRAAAPSLGLDTAAAGRQSARRVGDAAGRR